MVLPPDRYTLAMAFGFETYRCTTDVKDDAPGCMPVRMVQANQDEAKHRPNGLPAHIEKGK